MHYRLHHNSTQKSIETLEALETIYERILIENDNRNKLSRFFSPSNIDMFKSTAEVAGNKPFSTDLEIKIFKPSNQFRLFIILLTVGFWCFVLYLAFNKKKDDLVALIFTFFIGVILLVNILWQYFYDPKTNFTLSINGIGIQIDETVLEWSKIRQTSILTLPKGKFFTTHLVIILRDDEYWICNLDFDIKSVSKHIEFYKNHTLQSSP